MILFPTRLLLNAEDIIHPFVVTSIIEWIQASQEETFE